MKQTFQLIMKFALTFLLLCLVSASAVAQQTFFPSETVEPFSFTTYAVTFALLALFSTAVTEIVKKLCKNIWFNIPAAVILLLSWVVPILLSLLASVLNIGIYEHLNFTNSILVSFSAALCSNGIFDCLKITGILRALGLEK